jgi:hypothetical protein
MSEELPDGVTLRDWYATKAPITLIDVQAIEGSSLSNLRLEEYRAQIMQILIKMQLEYADAYMKEREK